MKKELEEVLDLLTLPEGEWPTEAPQNAMALSDWARRLGGKAAALAEYIYVLHAMPSVGYEKHRERADQARERFSRATGNYNVAPVCHKHKSSGDTARYRSQTADVHDGGCVICTTAAMLKCKAKLVEMMLSLTRDWEDLDPQDDCPAVLENQADDLAQQAAYLAGYLGGRGGNGNGDSGHQYSLRNAAQKVAHVREGLGFTNP